MHPSEGKALVPLTLVVDDDPMVRLIATQTLTQHGLRVIEASGGEQALELFEPMKTDLVLLDLLMPGIDGYETCRRMRELKRGRYVPVLMLTGLDDLDSINHAYEVGTTDFVSKPISWAILGHRVRYMLRAAETFKDLAESQAMLSRAQRIARIPEALSTECAQGRPLLRQGHPGGLSGDAAITSAIIAMAHSLKLEVVADGVATEAQREFLRNRGCEYLHGYLISRPMPAPDFRALLSGATSNGFVRSDEKGPRAAALFLKPRNASVKRLRCRSARPRAGRAVRPGPSERCRRREIRT